MRLFVAVDVGDDVRAEVSRVCATIDAKLEAAPQPPRVLWVAPRALHLTLRFLGEVAPDALAGVCQALEPPIALDPFVVEWRGLGAFPAPHHPRALWMGLVSGAAPLGRLEADVSRRLGAVEIDPHPFRPHVTIGRVKTPGAGADWPAIIEKVDVRGVRTHVRHVALYRSELSPRGAHYTVVMKAPLVGA